MNDLFEKHFETGLRTIFRIGFLQCSNPLLDGGLTVHDRTDYHLLENRIACSIGVLESKALCLEET
jgi:hypothetical protein